MTRLLLVLGLLALSAATQEVHDVLPPGMRLDATGQLRWRAMKPMPCLQCGALKRVPCRRCEGDDTSCDRCTARFVPCGACAATGRAVDPYVETLCLHCDGEKVLRCPRCQGSREVVTAAGGREACDGCRGQATLQCPLCAGQGLLALHAGEEADPRLATAEDLETRRRTLEELWSGVRGAQRAARADRLEADYTAFLTASEAATGLPAGQADRLLRLVTAARGDGDPELAVRLELSRHGTALEQFLEIRARLLERCRWRLEYNAGTLGSGEPTRARGLLWNGWLAEEPGNPGTVFSLLGLEPADAAADAEAAIRTWLAAHPDAVVVPVARLRRLTAGEPDSMLVHVWVVDRDESLNLHLVASGRIDAAAMLSPRPEIEVPLRAYAAFLHEIRAAGRPQARPGVPAVARDPAAEARRLRENGRFAAALAELMELVDAGDANAYRWLDIAECHEQLGQLDEALAAYDEAIGDGSWLPAYTRKAHFLRRTRSLEAAVAWLGQQAALAPREPELRCLLGSFLRECGRPRDAIPHFERAVLFARLAHGFVFDAEGWLVLDEDTLAEGVDDYADLRPSLEHLAELHDGAGNTKKALRYATMGVAIGQQINRCKGYYNATEIEAGSLTCRTIRAHIHLEAGRWQEAEVELGFAKTLADRGCYEPARKRVDQLLGRLAARRTDREGK